MSMVGRGVAPAARWVEETCGRMVRSLRLSEQRRVLSQYNLKATAWISCAPLCKARSGQRESRFTPLSLYYRLNTRRRLQERAATLKQFAKKSGRNLLEG